MSISANFPQHAKWIGTVEPPIAEQHENGNPVLCLHRTFEVTETAPARVLYAGLGLSVVHINGRRVGDAVLQTAFTDYRKSVICAEEDVTALLRVGTNEIEVALGDGWYNQTAKDTWGFYHAEWRGERKLRLALFVGEKEVLCSDESWSVSTNGVIRESALRLGETHDCNRRIDWKTADRAIEHPAPAGRLKLCDMPPIRECECLDFVSCTDYGEGYLLDFGKNIAGYVRLNLQLPKGTTVRVIHGDRLENQRIDNESNAQYIKNENFSYQTDTYIADGETQCFFPLFAYHGFQYAEIEGLPDPPQKGEVQGISIHSDFRRIGSFRCSDADLNRLYDMSLAAAEANFQAFPSDCPHREKNGWTGDGQLSAEQYLLNYDCAQNLCKWLEDMAESQREDGAIPAIVPTAGWGFTWGNGPAWDFALFALPHLLKQYRGIENPVLQTAIRYHAFLQTKSVDDLVDWGLGDWNFPKCVPKDRIAPRELTSSCYYLQMTRFLAEWTGEEKYTELAERIGKAILAKYGNADQMGALAALTYFGLSDRTDALLESLEQAEYHYAAGILGVYYINNVLLAHGRCDVFLRLLRTRGYPSFLEWADRGGTALWEDFEGTNSRCHHMYSDIAAGMIKGVAGIRVLAADRVDICPDPVDLTEFEAMTELPAGRIAVAYREGKYQVEIPQGVRACFCKRDRRIELSAGVSELNA